MIHLDNFFLTEEKARTFARRMILQFITNDLEIQLVYPTAVRLILIKDVQLLTTDAQEAVEELGTAFVCHHGTLGSHDLGPFDLNELMCQSEKRQAREPGAFQSEWDSDYTQATPPEETIIAAIMI